MTTFRLRVCDMRGDFVDSTSLPYPIVLVEGYPKKIKDSHTVYLLLAATKNVYKRL